MSEPCWQAVDYRRLLIRQWDDEVFLFNPASGHTHLLNMAAAELLAQMADMPLDLDALCTRFFVLDAELDAATFRAVLAEHLEQLELLGLIRAGA